jgi:murein DD-endopeptidase MepM/ murein hydrolase activator NlpD
VKPYTSGIRHDYKNNLFERPPRKRYWSWFAAGLSLPLVGVALLLALGPPGSPRSTNAATVAASPPGTAAAAASPDASSAGARADEGHAERSVAELAAGASSAVAAAVQSGVRLGSAALPLGSNAEPTGPLPFSGAAPSLASATAAFASLAASAALSRVPLGPSPVAATPAGAGVLSAGALGLAAEPELSAALGGMAEKAGAVLDLVVKQGDSLDRLFRRNHLSLSDLAAMIRLKDVAEYLKMLKPGDAIRIAHDGERVLGLTRELDEVKLLSIVLDDDGYKATEINRPIDVRRTSGRGVIQTSLFDAASAAGISDAVTMNMAGIFQWDIDFIQDVREGDSFTVIYEERWRDGVKLGNGPILAAEFVNQGQTYRAALYTDVSGHSDYYTPDGRSLRKAFIRAPVDFTRISSNFDLHRRHPILNTIRAHRGVDYAAPIGTPVHASGDGKVIFRGVQGGYGNVVILQHGGNITTLYGHLSRFGKYKVGSRVRQGDVIAYVGKSGLATGPHLHYEYRIAGVHRNPRTVTLPPADPVPAQYRDDFTAKTAQLWEALDGLEPSGQFATASN